MRRDGTEACRPHPWLCGFRTRRLQRWVGAVRVVVAVSQHLLDAHGSFFAGIERRVIRNPVRALPRELVPPGSSLRRLGYIGALHPNKGVDVLIRALPALERRGIVLRVAGKGVLEDAVARAAAESPALEYVGFASGEEKLRFLESCDLGIVPSIWREPGGPTWTVSEWLAARRPVLVSPRGGLAEVAGIHPAAIAVEPTVDDIVRCVDRLLAAETWASIVREANDLDVHDAVQRWTSDYLSLYREILGSSP